MNHFEDAVAIVTGGSQGIGRAIAGSLAEEGASVVILDSDKETAQSSATAIQRAEGTAQVIVGDVREPADVDAAISTAREFGGVDILVNNAGGVYGDDYPDGPTDAWMQTLDVNLQGTLLCTERTLRTMDQGGVIVSISSMAGIGLDPYPWGSPAYAAANAGILRMTTVLGHLREKQGVRLHAIAPDWVATDAVKEFLATASSEERQRERAPPDEELIHPKELAEFVVEIVQDDDALPLWLWANGEGPQALETFGA